MIAISTAYKEALIAIEIEDKQLGLINNILSDGERHHIQQLLSLPFKKDIIRENVNNLLEENRIILFQTWVQKL